MTDTREEIIREIQRVAQAIEPEPLTQQAYNVEDVSLYPKFTTISAPGMRPLRLLD